MGAVRRIKAWTVTACHGPRYPAGAMFTLLDDLDAFFLEHRRCGELDGGVEDGRVWMTCEWGASLPRSLTRSDTLPATAPTSLTLGLGHEKTQAVHHRRHALLPDCPRDVRLR